MNTGDLPATVLWGAVAASVDPGMVWVVLLAVVSALALAGVLCWPWKDDEQSIAPGEDLAQPSCPCGACGAIAYDSADEDDDLMDLADTLFGPDTQPVNEARDDRWGDLDGRNRGAWLDHVSRTANTQNARWITGRQQEEAGMSLADEVAEYLEAEARRPGETTGEIRRGDPGE